MGTESEHLSGLSAEGAPAAVEKNLRRTATAGAAVTEKRFAHIKELAELLSRRIRRETGVSDVLRAVLSFEGAVPIYHEWLAAPSLQEVPFGEINRAEKAFFLRQLGRYDRFYLSKCLAEQSNIRDLKTMIPLIVGELAEIPSGRDRRVAFLRNRQASRAFERFARYLGGVSAVYEDNFQSACESVYTGETTYAIIPTASTSDGRLNSFYRQMEKYDLNIVLSCDIDSDDGENSTTFALVYRDRLYIEIEGIPLYECKITLDRQTDIADIADAAAYFGATMESAEALPLMFSGRTNAFGMIFGLKNADVGGFFTYLALEYPQTAAVGIYDRTERAES